MDDLSETALLEDFADYVLPLLKPYEACIYLLLLRLTYVAHRPNTITVGMRTIAAKLGRGTRSESGGNFRHIREVLGSLEQKGCIVTGVKSREGTLITVKLPREIPAVREAIAAANAQPAEANYFVDPDLRVRLFERDSWSCCYCGEVLTNETATLDHKIPSSLGGTDVPENLATCCFICNSLKSGKLYDEAAPAILKAIRERRSKG